MMVLVFGPAADVIDRRRALLVAAAADRSAARRSGRWFLVTNAPALARIAIDVGDGVHAVVSGTASGWWWHVECGVTRVTEPCRAVVPGGAVVLARMRAEAEADRRRREAMEVHRGRERDLRDGGGGRCCPAGRGAGDVLRPDGQPVAADGGVPARRADGRRAPVAA